VIRDADGRRVTVVVSDGRHGAEGRLADEEALASRTTASAGTGANAPVTQHQGLRSQSLAEGRCRTLRAVLPGIANANGDDDDQQNQCGVEQFADEDGRGGGEDEEQQERAAKLAAEDAGARHAAPLPQHVGPVCLQPAAGFGLRQSGGRRSKLLRERVDVERPVRERRSPVEWHAQGVSLRGDGGKFPGDRRRREE
jgi:hypothetical protein